VREGAEAGLNEPFVNVLPPRNDVPSPSPTRPEETRPSGGSNRLIQNARDVETDIFSGVAGNNNEVNNDVRTYRED
jgi:hypothetical protein